MDAFADGLKDIPIKFEVDEASIAKVEAVANALADSLRPEIHFQADLDALNAGKLVGETAAAQTAADGLSNSIRRLGEADNLTAKDAYMLAMAQTMQAKAANAGADADDRAAKNTYLLAMAQRMSDNSAKQQAASMRQVADDVNAYSNRVHGWFSLLTHDFTLFGGLLGDTHMIGSIQGWHIALDGLLEATIALGGALLALSIGAAAVAPAAEDIYTHLKSVNDVSTALGVTIPPLTGNFQALSQSVAPQALEAFGGALNLLNNGSGAFAKTAHEVVTGLDDWIAKLDIFMNAQGHMGGLMLDGVGFLHQFEVAADNVGKAIVNLAKADPGTAHFLMDIAEGASKALDVFTELPTPILLTIMAIHSFLLWGGLLTTWALKIASPFMTFGTTMITAAAKMGLLGDAAQAATIPLTDLRTAESMAAAESTSFGESLAAFATNPFTWVVIAAAGLAYLGYQETQASAGAKNLINSLNTQVNSDTASQAVTDISSAVGQLNQALNQTQQNLLVLRVPIDIGGIETTDLKISSMEASMRAFGEAGDDMKKHMTGFLSFFSNVGGAIENTAKGIGDATASAFGGPRTQNDINAYKGAIVSLTGEQKNLFNETGALMRQGFTFSQSLGLLDLAGVQASDSFDVMKQKVSNLLAGYQAMGIQAGLLGNSINAVTFASEQQDSKVAALTQGWSAFIGMLTGGESAFTTYETQLQGLGTAASGTAGAIKIVNGVVSDTTKATGNTTTAVTAAAKAMNGLSANSLQLRGSFTTAITDASDLQNNLITMASAAGLGAKGVTMLSQAGKDAVAQLLPLGKGSAYATSMLYGLAQQAGYQGVDSFKALSEWVGKTKNPMDSLDSIVNTLTTDSANLTQDVNNLANALNSNLNQAMAAAIVQASGGQVAFDQFATATMNGQHNASLMKSSATQLATELIDVTGNANSAHGEFDTFATAMGWSKQQADSLWKSVENVAQAMASIHSVTASINISENIIHPSAPAGTYPTPTGIAPGFSGLASGGRIPGYGGGDTYGPIMVEPGEAVVPKHLVSGVAPYLGSHGVPGFAEGGYVGGGSPPGGGQGVVEVNVYLDGKQIQKSTQKQTYKVNRRNGTAVTGKMSPR
jgi:hypothetical protein